MDEGRHQVADKSLWQFGIREVNPHTSGNEVRRRQWTELCSDCHEQDWSARQLAGLEAERKRAWDKPYRAEDILKALRSDGLLYPAAGERSPYPNDWLDELFPRARVGFFEGQASAFYNVSPIERDYFEMWYFDNLGAYKGTAHGDAGAVEHGHAAMDRALQAVREQALQPRSPGELENAGQLQRLDPARRWQPGAYTEYNREQN
jgi:hydroxylamine dehydrogenase